MEIKHLEEFVTFSETKNFTRAARALYISQPSLSQHIARMEAELGFKLVERSSNGVALTKAGDVFLVQAKLMLDSYRSTVAACREIEAKDAAAIKLCDVRALTRFGDIAAIAQERGDFPSAYVPLDSYCDLGEFEALDAGVLDVSITFSPVPGRGLPDSLREAYGFLELPSETMLVKIPHDSSLLRSEHIAMESLDGRTVVENGYRFFRSSENAVQAICREHGLRMQYVQGSNQAKNTLLAVYPEYIAFWLKISYDLYGRDADPNCDFREIEGNPLAVTPMLIWRKDNPNAHVKEFLRVLKDALPRI